MKLLKIILLIAICTGCTAPQDSSTPKIAVDNVEGYLDPRLPEKEKAVMRNILQSMQPDSRSNYVDYIDSQGKQHSNNYERYHEIQLGLNLFEYNSDVGPLPQGSN